MVRRPLFIIVLYDGHDDVALNVVQQDVAQEDGAGVDQNTPVGLGSDIKCRHKMIRLYNFSVFHHLCSTYSCLGDVS